MQAGWIKEAILWYRRVMILPNPGPSHADTKASVAAVIHLGDLSKARLRRRRAAWTPPTPWPG
jgi:hypothetical protein